MTWIIARSSSWVTPLLIAPRQWVSHSAILPNAPIIDRFNIDLVLASITSSPQPNPQHHAVIASWNGRVKSSAAARFFSTYSTPSVALRCSSPLRKRSSSSVLMGLSFQPDGDILGLHVIPKRLAPFFAAIAGFAVAAKGGFHAARVPFVDEHLPRAQDPCGVCGAVEIGGEDARDKAIICAICDLNGLCVVAERHDGENRAEHLFPGNFHVRCHRQNRWFHEGPRAIERMTAGCQLCALILCCGDHTDGAVALRLGHHRAHVCTESIPLDARPDGEAPRDRFGALQHLVVAALMHDHAGHCRTHLARVEVDAPTDVILECFKVCICMHDGGGFASKFQHTRHHVASGGCGNCDPSSNGASKNKMIHIAMR